MLKSEEWRLPHMTFLTSTCTCHTTALVYGILSMLMAFLAKNMGGVLQIAIGVYGGCTGPILAMFVMALFVPFTNPKVGVLSSLRALLKLQGVCG